MATEEISLGTSQKHCSLHLRDLEQVSGAKGICVSGQNSLGPGNREQRKNPKQRVFLKAKKQVDITNFAQIKNFHSSKGVIKRRKRQTTDCEINIQDMYI